MLRPSRRNIEKALAFRPSDTLIEKFLEDNGQKYCLARRDVEDLFLETKKFLSLKALYPEYRFTPSRLIDDFWHTFLLLTVEYEKFSKTLGRFVHHMPSKRDLPKVEQLAEIVQPYFNTLIALKTVFGYINAKWWRDDVAGLVYPALLLSPYSERTCAIKHKRMAHHGVKDSDVQRAANRLRSLLGLSRADETQLWLKYLGMDARQFSNVLRELMQLTTLKESISLTDIKLYFKKHRSKFDKVTICRINAPRPASLMQLNELLSQPGIQLMELVSNPLTLRLQLTYQVFSSNAYDLPEELQKAKKGQIIGPVSQKGWYWFAQVIERRPAVLTRDLLTYLKDLLFYEHLIDARQTSTPTNHHIVPNRIGVASQSH